MKDLKTFRALVKDCPRDSSSISNLTTPGLMETPRPLRVLWMYPDTLSLHGGRGDLMALLRFATALGMPIEIIKVRQPGDEIPLEQADILYFCPGELRSVPALVKKLLPCRDMLQRAAENGTTLFACGSTGGIFANKIRFRDGTELAGLGLLDMEWQETGKVFGDDLWLVRPDGKELLGCQISLADVYLGQNQKPFATTRYGRGNCGDGTEGAETGNVIYTGLLGPILVNNPEFAVSLLRRSALQHGLISPEQELSMGDITLEKLAAEKHRAFIQEKMNQA